MSQNLETDNLVDVRRTTQAYEFISMSTHFTKQLMVPPDDKN